MLHLNENGARENDPTALGQAARAWTRWENRTSNLTPPTVRSLPSSRLRPFRLTTVCLESLHERIESLRGAENSKRIALVYDGY